MQHIDLKSLIRKCLAAASLAALCALPIALTRIAAQTVEGLNLKEVLARGSSQAGDAEAFVRGLTGKGDAFAGEAEAVAAKGRDAAAKINQAELPRGPQGPIDFDSILNGAAANAATPMGEGPLLIVFASLSMPEASLARLIADTARAGGIVVFRGFPQGSAKAFAEGLKRSVRTQAQEAYIAIDPRLFRAFGVTAAPTFVVTGAPYELCDGLDCTSDAPPHDRMIGNVTLGYALETFSSGHGAGAGIARLALSRLEHGGEVMAP